MKYLKNAAHLHYVKNIRHRLFGEYAYLRCTEESSPVADYRLINNA